MILPAGHDFMTDDELRAALLEMGTDADTATATVDILRRGAADGAVD